MNRQDFLEIFFRDISVEGRGGLFLIINDEGFEANPSKGWQTSAEGRVSVWVRRRINTKKMNKEVHGLDELIDGLKKLSPDKPLRYFDLLSKNYIGECVFCDGRFVGCAVTKRGGGVSIPV